MDLIYQYYRLVPGPLDEIEDMWELVKKIQANVMQEWRKPTRESGKSGARSAISSPPK